MSMNGETIDGASIGGAAALDEEAYQLWLRDYNAPIAHLVEIDYHDVSAVYPNWVTHTIKSSDRAGLSFTGYPDRIKSIGSFQRQIGDRFTGTVSASIGEITFHNAEGRLDLWHKLSIDGQTVRVYHGHPDWSRERFRLVYEAVAEKVSSSTSTALTIQLRGIDYKANLPIQTNLIGAATANGSANQPVPLAMGRVFNAEPVCIDLVNQVYQWNDGPVTRVSDVRDGGIHFQTAQIAISAVSGNVISTATAHGFVANTRVRMDIGSLPSAAQWQDVAWNGVLYCAIAFGSNVGAISADGLVWTAVTLPATANWYAIKSNGTVFCAIAYNSSIVATSPDGINWTLGAMPSTASWTAIDWNGSLYCAVAYNANKAATSPDGLNWTARTLPASAFWNGIIWAGTYWYAFAYNTTAASSTDGASWTPRTFFGGGTCGKLVWTGVVFCGTLLGTNSCITSPDGTTWTLRSLPVSDIWGGMVWNGTVICMAGQSSQVATSPDGINWTAVTLPGFLGLIPVGWNGDALLVLAGGTAASISYDNGTTWSATSGTLPTPLAAFTDYWVIPDGLTTTSFKVSATRGGAVLALTNTTTGGALIGYHWTADIATGKIHLDQKPAGKLTLDGVAGSTDAATIVIDALDAINVDPASLRKFQATCPQTMGIYIKDRRNRLDVAQDIVNGIGAWYGHGREGLLRFGRVEGNPAGYDHVLIADDMVQGSLQIEKMIPPEKRHRLSYRKNWTNQSGALFADVSPDNVTLFSNDFSVSQPVTGTDEGANGSFHALAVIPDAQETMIALASDAATEAARLDAMYFGWGAIFSVTARRIATQFDIGHVVKVVHGRYGLAAGVNMTVVYIDDNPTAQTVSIKFFVALSAYTPGQL